ncbi:MULTISPECIES: portal protein [unclassified Delftia]|uniref:portal protein n=1 Tax=unclassified Delftia TaxID=2613839 RepID=UPI0019001527|nr:MULTISPECIES: hypothetical protein [unclassified Delftia]MBK0115631.1 hypothetical protein [Delftia sp. S65]MBK0119512.1 hypothetical protein [Delftia sp. S67]MBK0130184.1 hypothetical protein [Delftia sp. S66]
MIYSSPPSNADLGAALTPQEYARIIDDILEQPTWRAQADTEADYVDGNQLDSELLARMRRFGIPPAKENIIGTAIRAVCGYEAKTRTDWRVTPDGDPGGQDVADALNFRLNQAERHSRADRAISEAFLPQISVGLGWVEVARASDPFAYPYRCRYIHRNEMWWDIRAKEPDLSDAHWLLRERFVRKERVAATFPKHKEVIMRADVLSGPGGFGGFLGEGGTSTGLHAGLDVARAWTPREHAWYRSETDELSLCEVWYRRWVSGLVLRLRGGRVVEFDESNQQHRLAVASGAGTLSRESIARLRRSYWIGPVCIHDGPTPYPHQHFPYVPFWGYREDQTGMPFGLVRDMTFAQDNLNSTIAKLRWGMASVRVERTKGATEMSSAQLRQQLARPDADIVLDDEHMEKKGARFQVFRDFQLNAQHFQLMEDSRRALGRVSPVTPAMQGQTGTARSGLQETTQVEQSQIGIADMMDNTKDARGMVGELLMALIIEDLGEEEQVIVIEGDVLNPPRTVVLNKAEVDQATGLQYRSNDVLRTRLKVALEDVPSTSSFRAQQLSSLSEAVKSLPEHIQVVALPFLIDLMDLPRKKQVVEAIRAATGQQTPEQIEQRVQQEVQAALLKAGHELKARELEMKERLTDAQIKKVMADAVQVGVQAAFSAMQGGAQVAMNPAIAPIADAIMKGAGYQKPNPGGDDPDFPVPGVAPSGPAPQSGGPGAAGDIGQVHENTSPAFPPIPQEPSRGMQGIETATPADNL